MSEELELDEKELDFKRNEAITVLAQNLPVLRAKLDLSQEELAKKIGVTRQTIINIEKSHNKKLSWTTYLALIMFFALNPLSAVLLGPLGILTGNVIKIIGASGALKAIESLRDVFKGTK